MRLAILILEGETEVRNVIERDPMGLSSALRIETTEDVANVWEVVSEIDADEDVLALVVHDHRMPGITGIEFIGQMMEDECTILTRKVLLTGRASLTDTICAVTDARLDQYVAKPRKAPELQEVVHSLLTNYMELAEAGLIPYLEVLGPQRAM